ncbi:hypothetical protein [Methanorbis rubei]|uniref:Uncharacterized protein n=1 Tax=Methanorbis rubei TaxID=3028300 RepID=A0AAE4MHA0_9EURY|nr:hypothetical protein [Methanocorpusculaceae archaeon Cs1]
MSDFPKKCEKLFISEGYPTEYSHIAWGDMNMQFYGYIQGYKNAADTLIIHALEKGCPFVLDTCVFPVCFLYRQYIELALKKIYLSNTKDTEEEKKTHVTILSA